MRKRDYEQEIIDAFAVMVEARKAYRKKHAPLPDDLTRLFGIWPTEIYCSEFDHVVDMVIMLADVVALRELGTEAEKRKEAQHDHDDSRRITGATARDGTHCQ